LERALATGGPLWLATRDVDGKAARVELLAHDHGAHGLSIVRASRDGGAVLRRTARPGSGAAAAGASAGNGAGSGTDAYQLVGFGFREPIWHGPVNHSSISLGAASEDFLTARVEGNAGLSMTSSGEGGPIRLTSDDDMKWESLQAASGHFGIHAADLRRVRDVEIKINQGAKPGKGGRLSGAKVTPTVSRARNIPVGTDALSPDPKHDIYSIEDMPAEVWLWLLYHNHCGIKITGSNYTRFVAAGMWSNFVVDYLLVDAGLGGSGNYHADSSHVGWPDIFRTILHTHHALVSEKVDLEKTGELKPIRDLNGAPFGAKGGTRLFASGGIRGELDMVKVLIAGADALMEASIGKAVAFGCNQCGNCHLDCPRGGITTKAELTMQNDRGLMRQRFRNWTVLNMAKLAILIDALNRESGALAADGTVADSVALLDDIRALRGRTDLLDMPDHGADTQAPKLEADHDSCRVGSLTVSEPVDVNAIWESARLSYNGGNNRGGGIDFAGFAPAALREKTCLIFNTIGPDRADTMREMLGHLAGCRFFDARGAELSAAGVKDRLPDFRMPVRAKYAHETGWRDAELRENPGDFYTFFVELTQGVLERYGRALVESPHCCSGGPSMETCRKRRWTRHSRRCRASGMQRLSLATRRALSRPKPWPRVTPCCATGSKASSPTCERNISRRSLTCWTRATTALICHRPRPTAAMPRPASTPPSGAGSWFRWAKTWARSRCRAGPTPSPSTSTSSGSGRTTRERAAATVTATATAVAAARAGRRMPPRAAPAWITR
ncbi:MAG: glutamate synthase-related protein, partial [Candidatus Eisenbacteria bacterium]